MNKWEYHCLLLGPEQRLDWQEFMATEKHIEALEKKTAILLNERGREGWELVAVQPFGSEQTQYLAFFKREKTS